MSEFSDADLKEFVIEANELLEAAEMELLQAEKEPSDTFYDAVFRAFHSIKGGAGMLGMPELQSHMHKVESLWGALKGKSTLDKVTSEYFLLAVDGGKKLLQRQAINFDYSGPHQSTSTETNPQPTSATPPPTPPLPDKKAALREGIGVVFALDDEPAILEIVADILEEDGFEVICFTDPDALITKFQERVPDLVITDFKMPKKSGLDILREVKRVQPDVPVIMLSGFLTKDILVASLRDGGFFGALEKPFKQTDLLRECWSAFRHYEVQKMMRRSLNLLVYQFSDLEKYLISQGKADVAKTIGRELKELLAKQRALANRSTSS